jgi:hypothetical protein
MDILSYSYLQKTWLNYQMLLQAEREQSYIRVASDSWDDLEIDPQLLKEIKSRPAVLDSTEKEEMIEAAEAVEVCCSLLMCLA